MTRVLIVTGGNTDIQVAVDRSDGRTELAKLAEFQMRDLHLALMSGRIAYRWDASAADAPNRDDLELHLATDGHPKLARSNKGAPSLNATIPVLSELVLVPAKLAGIEAMLARPNKRPDVVIFFNTARGHRAKEPVGAGPLLSEWASEAMNLDRADLAEGPVANGVVSVDYSDAEVSLDGPDGTLINPLAVQRIDDALRQIAGPVNSVTFALNGGIPVYRDQIRACAMFRFPEASFHEVSRKAPDGVITSRKPSSTPADSMRLRQDVRRLLMRGDFSGAYAIADQLTDTRPILREDRGSDLAWPDDECDWIRPVHAAHLLFEGRLPPDLQGDRDEVFQQIVGPSAPRCMLTAFRAEAALRAGKWPEAVLWTFAFRETAMIDLISDLEFVDQVDVLDKSLTVTDRAAIPGGLVDHEWRREHGSYEACLKPLRGKIYGYSTGRNRDDDWISLFGDDTQATVRKLTEALEHSVDRSHRGIPLREVRNAIVHSSLPQDNMNWVRGGFQEVGLWSDAEANDLSKMHFLDGQEVNALCQATGGVEPSDLYRRLVSGLIDGMIQHRYS